MDELHLSLPFPPSVNDYYGKAIYKDKKTGRLRIIQFLTKRAKEYRQAVIDEVYLQIGLPPRLRCPLAVVIESHQGPGKKQDIDTGHKALLDSMEHARVYINDSQIDELLTVRKRRAAVGRVDVTLHKLE